MATCVQFLQWPVTITFVPYVAWVSSLPTSHLFCARLISLTHAPGRAGLPSAGLSTRRGYHGFTQAVATLTSTQQVPATQAAGARAAPAGAVELAVAAVAGVRLPMALAVRPAAVAVPEPHAASSKAVAAAATIADRAASRLCFDPRAVAGPGVMTTLISRMVVLHYPPRRRAGRHIAALGAQLGGNE